MADLTPDMTKISDKKFKNMILNLDVGYYIAKLDGIILFHNSIFNKILGYNPFENLIGKRTDNIWQNPKERLVYIDCLKRNGFIKDYFIHAIKKDKTKVVLQVNAHLVQNESENSYNIEATLSDVTEKYILEQKLKESEEKYRLISENANDLITVLNNNLEFEYVSKESCYIILGLSNRDLIGKSILSLIHPEDLKQAEKNFGKIFEIGEIFDEYRIKDKKGRYLWLEIRGKAFTDSEGFLKGHLILRDISKQKKAEQKLKESEEKFRNIAKQLLMGICILQDDVIKYVNKKFAKIIGYPEEEIINWNAKEYLKAIHPDDRQMVVEQVKKRSEDTNIINHFPIRGIKKSGEIVWVDNYAKIILFNQRPAILITVIDITEKSLAKQKLKESEIKYRSLFEKSPFSVILIDPEGKIVDCNPSTEKLIQYKKDEVIGKKFITLSIVPQKYIALLIKHLRDSFQADLLPPIEIQLHKKDGGLIWTRLQSSLIKIGDKTLNQVINYDITKRKQAENLVIEEVNRLKYLDEIRKELIARISHELKTPIMSVCGTLELLFDVYKDELGKEVIDLLEILEKGGNRLEVLVNNLIDIVSINTKKLELNKQMENLSEIVEYCSREMNYLIEERKIILKLDLLKELYLELDRNRIEQVILNLLSNAIKNTPPKGNIKITLKKKENYAQISIGDTGVGLTKDEMERMFIPFGKIERYGKELEFLDIQGSGLGLYITKEIVNLHRGKIWAESAGSLKGSTFTVRLPIK